MKDLLSKVGTYAYLQVLDIQRQILVKPQPEAGLSGKLWLLKKAAYGISDGGRMFNLCSVHADGTLFSYVKDGKLHGLIVSHVNDLLLIGDKQFEADIERGKTRS